MSDRVNRPQVDLLTRLRSQRSPQRAKSPAKPNFGNSGLLAAETNTVKVTPGAAAGAGQPAVTGVVLKYNEPPEARKPTRNWRLYVFKGPEQVGEWASRGMMGFLVV